MFLLSVVKGRELAFNKGTIRRRKVKCGSRQEQNKGNHGNRDMSISSRSLISGKRPQNFGVNVKNNEPAPKKSGRSMNSCTKTLVKRKTSVEEQFPIFAAVTQWLIRASNKFLGQNLSGAGSSPAGSICRDLITKTPLLILNH